VELGALVPVAMLSSSKLTEVFGSFRNNVVVKFEDDTTCVITANCDVELE
jgi:hypothetical protein